RRVLEGDLDRLGRRRRGGRAAAARAEADVDERAPLLEAVLGARELEELALLLRDRRAREPDRHALAPLVVRDLAVREVERLPAHHALGLALVLRQGAGGDRGERRGEDDCGCD